ncbi:MAG: secondary thiamine-phosphate synthase enzyme YjbQ [Phycisphaerales bacterium]
MSLTREFSVRTRGRGLHEITREVAHIVHDSDVADGLCTVFIRHTSASLTIQENADPSARADLEAWMDRHVPDGDPHHTHTDEGPDDMPSHIRSAITNVSISIPVMKGSLVLGTWQGIYVWEHRLAPQERRIVVHIGP